MIYTDLTKKAMILAYEAHKGQTDMGGIPYVFHPLHLAEQMTDEYTTCIALLHDVIEDSNLTLKQLEQSFPPKVTEAVSVLTRDFDMAYMDYIRLVSENPLAVRVKLADLEHNLDSTRLPEKPDDGNRAAFLRKRYEHAREYLLARSRE